MPTTHVEPTTAELMQEVADGLLKVRKVVVVTGAGISTNSGIPVCYADEKWRSRTDRTNGSRDDYRTFDRKMDCIL